MLIGGLLKSEYVRALRLLHAFLEILPLLRPGAAVHVGDLVLDHLAGVYPGRNPLDRIDRRNALDEGEGIAFLIAAQLHVVADDTDRLLERLGVVENRLVIESDELAVLVSSRRVDL